MQTLLRGLVDTAQNLSSSVASASARRAAALKCRNVDDAVTVGLSEADAEADVVRQLRAIGGDQTTNADFIVEHRGVKVWVNYSSGSGSNVRFSVLYGLSQQVSATIAPRERSNYRAAPTSDGVLRARRPMAIMLREERPDDVEGKQANIAVEVQTGDAEFDDEVYIDTTTEASVVKAVLASNKLRQAVRALRRESISTIVLDDELAMIRCTLSTFAHAHHDATRAVRILDALTTIALETPPVEHSGEPAPRPQMRWIEALLVLGGFNLFFGVPIYAAIIPGRCWESAGDGEGQNLVCRGGCCAPIWQGFLLGLALAILVASTVPRFIRGRSDSHHRRSAAWFLLGWVVLTVTMFVFGVVRYRL